ncbi:MAG: NUDIX domain-containing protein [Bacteriovoracia bacterium]
MSNPYEAGERRVIPAVLIYARDAEGADADVLMLHRNGEKHASGQDFHGGKWNGLGGKFELGESPIQCARREFFEEAGVDLPENAFVPLGVLQFPLFKPAKHEDWLVYVFSARIRRDEPGLKRICPEGELAWVPAARVSELNLWAGDRHFLPYVIERRSFWGTIWYERGAVARTWIQLLNS